VDVEDDRRLRQVEQVGIAGDVARVVLEALAAVGLLPADVPLDEHAPRPVEHDDPLVEKVSQLFGPVRHPRSACRKSRGHTAGLFRRLVTRSPSCQSKLSGCSQLS
jgi:hypothetical protein